MILTVKKWAMKNMASAVQGEVEKQTNLYGDSYWYAHPNLWEPSVLIALKDLCRPGAIVFDVGANMGGVTSAISRLVGPKGQVCAFEASPRIVGHLQGNVVKQGHHNVTVYHRAVYSKSDDVIMVYEGDHLNDSVFADNSPNKVGRPVRTLALDDFSFSSGLIPDVIKMDIEGAEYEALIGAQKLIEMHRPHLVLEQQVNDSRCFDFLVNLGYRVIDLATCREMISLAPSSGAPLLNLLYVHRERLSATPYRLPFELIEAGRIDLSQFEKNQQNGITSKAIQLQKGRYLVHADFAASGTSNSLMCGVKVNGAVVLRYHAYSKLLADTYRDWVIDLPADGDVSIYFEFMEGTADDTFRLKEIKLNKLKDVSAPLWSRLALD